MTKGRQVSTETQHGIPDAAVTSEASQANSDTGGDPSWVKKLFMTGTDENLRVRTK
jgi:hypothetical protein